MSAQNFRLYAEVIIQDRLDAIQSGKIRTNVSNQFDKTACECALRVIEEKPEYVEQRYEEIYAIPFKAGGKLSPVDLAHSLAKPLFEAEELDSAWVD